MPYTACVLTVSDRCSAGTATDTSGPALVAALKDTLGFTVLDTDLVPDEVDQIRAVLRRWATGPRPDLILTTGGTGLSPRDVTPEATLPLLDRHHPQLLELARLRCLPATPKAYLSRGAAGTIGSTLVLNLPGSRAGAVETLQALTDLLPHALSTLRGEDPHAPRPL